MLIRTPYEILKYQQIELHLLWNLAWRFAFKYIYMTINCYLCMYDMEASEDAHTAPRPSDEDVRYIALNNIRVAVHRLVPSVDDPTRLIPTRKYLFESIVRECLKADTGCSSQEWVILASYSPYDIVIPGHNVRFDDFLAFLNRITMRSQLQAEGRALIF